MWKRPNRPSNEISQTFNDGFLTVYSVEPGVVPDHISLAGLIEKATLLYAERRVGAQRFYSGIQAQTKVDRMLRVQHTGHVDPHDIVITESGKHYTVQLVQPCYDIYPPSVDLTLAAIDQSFTTAVLISREYYGDGWHDVSTTVRCSVQAVDVKEYYAAHTAGMRPELTLVLPDYRDYGGQTLVEYAGQRYRILRAARSEQQISLTLERASEEEQEETDE